MGESKGSHVYNIYFLKKIIKSNELWIIRFFHETNLNLFATLKQAGKQQLFRKERKFIAHKRWRQLPIAAD